MKNIARLLNDLNNMTPLSAGFWNEIQPLVIEKHRKLGYLFLKPGQIASKAWYLIAGFILTIRAGSDREEIVEKIYYPKDIVTDLESFFELIPVRFKFLAVGEVTVLEIKRPGITKLEQYPETCKLIQHVTFIEKKGTEEILQMLRLPEEERVKFFLENYPVTDLPPHYGASFLNLSLDKYLTQAQQLASSNQIKTKESEDLENTNTIAYKIMAYLIANYAQPEIGNTKKIAAMFNMTSVTLNRLFTKIFGFTVYKFITKQRMTNAEKLLKSEPLTVGKVALAVGYKNIFHFSKVFKSYYGYPPKQNKKRKHSQ
ncbi:helix-turn-helix domain-containing protein [Pedobacter sp. N36a]|uniref:helix-turn-helix domain-containing protein n=1 Tax=Pedobacter sp. N36a TaxID=2767996 RepID=UPI0016574E4C|nr:AraC family transcriptional regulator [Pedobacter sp. N36a]MBC8986506.1 helix-turn-helix domain-containing protein [Pedobacter sp. N36a]